jgi:hypothetical protein
MENSARRFHITAIGCPILFLLERGASVFPSKSPHGTFNAREMAQGPAATAGSNRYTSSGNCTRSRRCMARFSHGALPASALSCESKASKESGIRCSPPTTGRDARRQGLAMPSVSTLVFLAFFCMAGAGLLTMSGTASVGGSHSLGDRLRPPAGHPPDPVSFWDLPSRDGMGFPSQRSVPRRFSSACPSIVRREKGAGKSFAAPTSSSLHAT